MRGHRIQVFDDWLNKYFWLIVVAIPVIAIGTKYWGRFEWWIERFVE